MFSFVLVHGGQHGGWCWDKVTQLIADVGHHVVAPDLPAMGENRAALADVTFENTADYVESIVRRSGENVVLVGHSMSGRLIAAVAERAPECLIGTVYVAAMLLPPGALASSYPEMAVTLDAIRYSEDGISASFDRSLVGDLLYSRTLGVEADRAIARLTPQPLAVMSGDVPLSAARFGRVPRAYVECTMDHAIPIAMQRRMYLETACDPIFSIDTDHSPFLSAPEELAEHLVSAARIHHAMNLSSAIDNI